MKLLNKILIGLAILIILPVAGGIVGYSQKECPEFDQFRYDSLVQVNAELEADAAVLMELADSLATADSIRQAASEPAKVIYKKHALRLSTDTDLDELQRLLLAEPAE
jgi:hypothetical protein